MSTLDRDRYSTAEDTFSKRRVFVNVQPSSDFFDEHGTPKQLFLSNETQTAKYNPVTFIPKTLFEQFRYFNFET
jgi:hypothetical protein